MIQLCIHPLHWTRGPQLAQEVCGSKQASPLRPEDAKPFPGALMGMVPDAKISNPKPKPQVPRPHPKGAVWETGLLLLNSSLKPL